jgi:hypothetical protein
MHTRTHTNTRPNRFVKHMIKRAELRLSQGLLASTIRDLRVATAYQKHIAHAGRQTSILHRQGTQTQALTLWRRVHVYTKHLDNAELHSSLSHDRLRLRQFLKAWKSVHTYYTHLSEAYQIVASQRMHAQQKEPLCAWSSVQKYYTRLAHAYKMVSLQRNQALQMEPLQAWNCLSAWKKRKVISSAVISNQHHHTVLQDALDCWSDLSVSLRQRRVTAADLFCQRNAELIVAYFYAFRDTMGYFCHLHSAYRHVRTRSVRKERMYTFAKWQAGYYLIRCGPVYVCMYVSIHPYVHTRNHRSVIFRVFGVHASTDRNHVYAHIMYTHIHINAYTNMLSKGFSQDWKSMFLLERERMIFITHLKPLQPKTAITDDLIW